MASVTGKLTAEDRDQLQTLRSFRVWNYLYLLLFPPIHITLPYETVLQTQEDFAVAALGPWRGSSSAFWHKAQNLQYWTKIYRWSVSFVESSFSFTRTDYWQRLVRALSMWSTGHGRLDSWPPHCGVATLCKSFTHPVPLSYDRMAQLNIFIYHCMV